MKRLFSTLLATLLVTSVCSANVSDHLVGVQRTTVRSIFPPTIQQTWGNGICVNDGCSIIATAYHNQALVGRANLGVAGGHTKKVVSLANSGDGRKVPWLVGHKMASFDIQKDVAFIYTKKAVAHKTATPYSYMCYAGENVQIVGYVKHKLETREAIIIGTNVPSELGTAELHENLILNVPVDPGASGSGVFDKRGNLLGMVILTATLRRTSGTLAVSIALPVKTIAKALLKLDPVAGFDTFKDLPEDAPKYETVSTAVDQEGDSLDIAPVAPELSAIPMDVPDSVEKLRAKAAAASKVMANLISKQCWAGELGKPLCYELSISDGQQILRKIEKNGKLGKPTDSFPAQKQALWQQNDWAERLAEIAENPWVFRGAVDNHYLFTFKSGAEDERCYFEEYPQGVPLFGGRHPDWKGWVACFEQVVTDKDFNVLAVYDELMPPEDCLTQVVDIAIYYDSIKLEDLKSPILLPIAERITSKVQGRKKLSYASVSWTDYKKFRADHKLSFQ